MTSCLDDDDPKDLSCLPDNRIHCSTGKILVGQQEFLSATEALLAYLQQFDVRTRTKQQQDAYDLLVARTKMTSHRSRSLENEVKDSLLAVRKKRMRRILNRKKLEQFGLQKEVEDALSRSADLLVRLNDDEGDVPVCISDIGSMTTDLLLTSNPLERSTRNPVFTEDERNQGHVYSYRTPRSRFHSVGSVAPHTSTTTRPAVPRPSFGEGDCPVSGVATRHQRSSSSSSVRTLPRPDFGKRFRSRSASPVPVHLPHPSLVSSHTPPAPSQRKSVPSWVNTLDMSLEDPGSSLATSVGRAPSWVNDAARSDTTADSLLLNGLTELSLNKSMQNKSNLTDSRPGLNFSDLATSQLSKYSNRHSFNDSEKKVSFSPSKQTSANDGGYRKPDDNTSQQSSSPRYKVYTATSPSREKGSGRAIFDDSVQLTTSLDRYLERLEAETAQLSPLRSRSKMATIPKCSSLDSESRKSPRKCQPQSDITGASSIHKDSNMNLSLPPNHVHFSPSIAGINRSPSSAGINHSPGTDVILDADRSWENPLKAYKTPVYIDSNCHKQPASPTLTGSEQPGSMEALKNMLFKLQAEESTAKTASDPLPVTKPLTNPLDLPALRDYNFRAEPGGQSLEKALVHLSRLKSLVQVPPSDSASTVTTTSALIIPGSTGPLT